MMRHLTYTFLLILGVAVSSPRLCAQTSPYKFDFGGSIGMSGYLGDANNSSLLKHPGLALDVNSRYIANTRWALRGMLSVVTLSGNTADMDNVLPDFENYKFTSTVFDLGARFEFNFFPYGIGETFKRLKRWSPYLTVGVGVCLASSGGDLNAAPTLPMGIGVKYKFSERLNFGAEFTMTKCFSDKIDGPVLNDLTGIKTDFFKNTDWYSKFTIGVTYEFGERCETCHYVD